jgi:hypothetical protein
LLALKHHKNKNKKWICSATSSQKVPSDSACTSPYRTVDLESFHASLMRACSAIANHDEHDIVNLMSRAIQPMTQARTISDVMQD